MKGIENERERERERERETDRQTESDTDRKTHRLRWRENQTETGGELEDETDSVILPVLTIRIVKQIQKKKKNMLPGTNQSEFLDTNLKTSANYTKRRLANPNLNNIFT